MGKRGYAPLPLYDPASGRTWVDVHAWVAETGLTPSAAYKRAERGETPLGPGWVLRAPKAKRGPSARIVLPGEIEVIGWSAAEAATGRGKNYLWERATWERGRWVVTL